MSLPSMVPSAPALQCRRKVLDFVVDPRALLHAEPGEPAFFWSAGGDQEIVASGVVHAIETAGALRFRDATAELGKLSASAPLVLGGFAFADEATMTGEWRDFPALSLHIPRIATIRRGDRTELFVATTGTDGPLAADAALERGEAFVRAATAGRKPGSGALDLRVRSRSPDESWQRAVEGVLAEIEAGRLEKLVLSRILEVTAGGPIDAAGLVYHLARAHPQASVFAVRRGGSTFIGASPEPLARVEGRRLRTGAVAGTARRGDGDSEERAAAAGLHASEKEHREHALVVADVVARLRPHCTSMNAAAAPETLVAGPVQHLRTPIEADLHASTTLLDIVEALHPTPALGGLPRQEVAAALARHEHEPRGWYGGGVGWINGAQGEVTVAIRTALLRGHEALLHAGAGIVAGSQWREELEETRLKLRTLLEALLEV